MEMDEQIIKSMDELEAISKEFPQTMTPLKRAAQMQGMKNNKELQNLLKEEEKEE